MPLRSAAVQSTRLFAVIALAASALAQHSPIDDVSPLRPTTTTTTIPGTGSSGWDWDQIEPCNQYTDVLEFDVRGPIEVTTTETLRVPAHRQQIRNCLKKDIEGPITYDMRYETTHAWSVGAGVTAGVEGQIESGLLARAIVDGRVSVSASARLEGEIRRSRVFEHGIEMCFAPIPSCFSIAVVFVYDNYESVVQQSVGNRVWATSLPA